VLISCKIMDIGLASLAQSNGDRKRTLDCHSSTKLPSLLAELGKEQAWICWNIILPVGESLIMFFLLHGFDSSQKRGQIDILQGEPSYLYHGGRWTASRNTLDGRSRRKNSLLYDGFDRTAYDICYPEIGVKEDRKGWVLGNVIQNPSH